MVFHSLWSGTASTADAELVIDGTQLGGRFGWSFVTDGGVDGDGWDDVVGAPSDLGEDGGLARSRPASLSQLSPRPPARSAPATP